MWNKMKSAFGGKRITLFLILCVCATNIFSQNNITNTLGTGGVFKIKSASNEYLTVSQSTGYLSLNKSLVMPNSTDSTLGVIFKGTDRFIHNYSPPGLEGYNTFIGINSGNFNMTGGYNTAIGDQTLFSNTEGYGNIALGFQSLYSNTTGSQNTAVGLGSLQNNISAYNNTAVGYLALNSNTTGTENTASGVASLTFNITGEYNTASGSNSLYSNTNGSYNTASGYQSLYHNITGYQNTAVGSKSLFFNTQGYYNTASGVGSLYSNTTGRNNTAMGYYSLYSNTAGEFNTAVGYLALNTNTGGTFNTAVGDHSLFSNTTAALNSAFGSAAGYGITTGGHNTAIGVDAGLTITTGFNNTAIGYEADVPSGTNSNQIRIGNTWVTYAGVQVAWSITSDRRWKYEIKKSALGLNFISKLKPVSYIRINDESKKTEFGLIAQEVEEVLKESGVENTGMITIDDKGMYQLRYNDLLAPMIKAIQELKAENDKLKATSIALTDRLTRFEQIQNMLAAEIENLKANSHDRTKVSLGEK